MFVQRKFNQIIQGKTGNKKNESRCGCMDSIEQQIEESGMAHMNMTGIGMGEMEEFGEVGELGDMGELSLVDASDYNL